MKKNWFYIIVAAVATLLIYLLNPILTPFFVAALFAYLGNPLVEKLQRWHLPRTLAASIVFIFLLALVVMFFVMLIPLLQKQTVILIQKIPAMMQTLQDVVIPWVNNQANTLNISQNIDPSQVQTFISDHWQEAGKILSNLWAAISKSGSTIVVWAMNLLLIPVVTFYLLRDWPNLLNQIQILLPRKHSTKITDISHECDEVLSAFFRGQLMVMIILGMIYAIGLSIVGLQVAILIGLIAGLLSIVPYLGFTVGLVSALLAALVQFHDGTHLIYVLIVFLIGNALEGMVLTPLLIGDKIGLHPVAVIFAILAGGHLFGFIGILLALPVAAVLMVVLRHTRKHYLKCN